MRIGADQPAFWRRTPPALFPATLGMFGLALAWRAAGEALGAVLFGLLAMAAAFALVGRIERRHARVEVNKAPAVVEREPPI